MPAAAAEPEAEADGRAAIIWPTIIRAAVIRTIGIGIRIRRGIRIRALIIVIAARSTGYVTPDQAARRAQTNGSVGGLLGGAALGAILGGRNAGTGAAIGAGAGLLAGSAVGASNADRAARRVERRYDDAYYDCLDANRAPPLGYAPGPNDGPPPPAPPPRGQYNDQDNDEPPPPPPRDRY